MVDGVEVKSVKLSEKSHESENGLNTLVIRAFLVEMFNTKNLRVRQEGKPESDQNVEHP